MLLRFHSRGEPVDFPLNHISTAGPGHTCVIDALPSFSSSFLSLADHPTRPPPSRLFPFFFSFLVSSFSFLLLSGHDSVGTRGFLLVTSQSSARDEASCIHPSIYLSLHPSIPAFRIWGSSLHSAPDSLSGSSGSAQSRLDSGVGLPPSTPLFLSPSLKHSIALPHCLSGSTRAVRRVNSHA